jgi:hypothetical protein
VYRERWQVEQFFRALKQSLRIKTFVGTSANAVLVQIWTALLDCGAMQISVKWILLKTALVVIGVFTISAPECAAREWFVSPDGTAGGDGTKERPWSLEAALKPHPMIAPMDTVWVRKGIYSGGFVGRLKGAPGKPVVLRAYPGERVVLDGRGAPGSSVLRIEGEWAWYWGLEVTNSDPRRDTNQADAQGVSYRGTGIEMFGTDIKVINCVVHDTGVGVGMAVSSRDQELYGVILYNNGWRNGDVRSGHSIYAQNQHGEKIIRDVILFSPYWFNMHIYGSRQAFLNNFVLEGNVGFNGRWLVRLVQISTWDRRRRALW